jgi:hypothetical protein
VAVVGLLRNKRTPPATRLACATTLLDRGWGRPVPVDGETNVGLTIKIMRFAETWADDPPTITIEKKS